MEKWKKQKGSCSGEVEQAGSKQCKGEHHQFGEAVDAYGLVHVWGREGAVILADVGLVKEFSEIVVRTTETAVENAG